MPKSDSLYAQFGKLIRGYRRRHKITQLQLGDRIGITRTSITNIEKGRQKVLLHQVFQLADALQVNPETPCVWLRGIERIDLPVRHGEGKFIPASPDVLERLKRQGQAALRYVRPDGSPAVGAFPWNPNGSADDIAGICDPSGRIFGLMPHPEAHQDPTNHPLWTRWEYLPAEGPGLRLFRNAVEFAWEQLC